MGIEETNSDQSRAPFLSLLTGTLGAIGPAKERLPVAQIYHLSLLFLNCAISFSRFSFLFQSVIDFAPSFSPSCAALQTRAEQSRADSTEERRSPWWPRQSSCLPPSWSKGTRQRQCSAVSEHRHSWAAGQQLSGRPIHEQKCQCP